MNETEFLTRWEQEAPLHEAWGRLILETVQDELSRQLAATGKPDILKIPSAPRLKEKRSLLDKAFCRGKKYDDPYLEIEDKVGLRFVVLLTDEIDVISSIIREIPLWSVDCPRDYKTDQEKAPKVFDYQSVHYILRPAQDIEIGEYRLTRDIACEVQVRTLLQHAHSELTHDTTYKPKTAASPMVARYCARSIALIECVDDLFLQVAMEIRKAGEPVEKAMAILDKIYRDRVTLEPSIGAVNSLIVDAFKDMLPENLEDELRAFLDRTPYLGERIQGHAKTRHLFRQPAALLVYYLATVKSQQTQENWPLTPEELQPFYSDLGISMRR